MADITDTDQLSLLEGLTISAAELTAYGATLSDVGALNPAGDPGVDVGAVAEGGALAAVATGTDTGVLVANGSFFASAPSGDGTDTGTLDDTGTLATVTVATPVVSGASVSATLYMERRRDFFDIRKAERFSLREDAYVEVMPVAPADTPPDPWSWLATSGDEDLVAVALIG